MCTEFGSALCTCRECSPLFGAYLHHSCFWKEPTTNTMRHSWALVDKWDGVAQADVDIRAHEDGTKDVLESRRFSSDVTDAIFAKFLKDALHYS